MTAAPHSLYHAADFTGARPTGYRGVYVWKQGPALWRILATDALGDTDITGPTYHSMGAALDDVPRVAATWGASQV